VNSSKVSSSCPGWFFFTLVVLNADFAYPGCTAETGNGALRIDLKAGLRQEEIGGRAARRITEVDAIRRRIGSVSSF
jgi:hypothetical protein